MRPPRNSPWWSSCMLSSTRHFSLGFRHFLLGLRHFSLGWCVCNSLCHNGLREMSFPNRLNNRLLNWHMGFIPFRPMPTLRKIGRSLRGGLEIVFLLYSVIRDTLCRMCRRWWAEEGKSWMLYNYMRYLTLFWFLCIISVWFEREKMLCQADYFLQKSWNKEVSTLPIFTMDIYDNDKVTSLYYRHITSSKISHKTM